MYCFLAFLVSSLQKSFSKDDIINKCINTDVSKALFIMFSSDNCPHCVSAKSQFILANSSSHNISDFVIIDGKKDIDLSRVFGVRYFPSFYLCYKGIRYIFTEDRTHSSMSSFINEIMSGDILSINKNWKTSIGKKVLLFMNRVTVPPQYISLYLKYNKYDINFGYSRDNETSHGFEVKKSGTFIFMNDDNAEVYNGPSRLNDVSAALEKFFSVYD